MVRTNFTPILAMVLLVLSTSTTAAPTPIGMYNFLLALRYYISLHPYLFQTHTHTHTYTHEILLFVSCSMSRSQANWSTLWHCSGATTVRRAPRWPVGLPLDVAIDVCVSSECIGDWMVSTVIVSLLSGGIGIWEDLGGCGQRFEFVFWGVKERKSVLICISDQIRWSENSNSYWSFQIKPCFQNCNSIS